MDIAGKLFCTSLLLSVVGLALRSVSPDAADKVPTAWKLFVIGCVGVGFFGAVGTGLFVIWR